MLRTYTSDEIINSIPMILTLEDFWNIPEELSVRNTKIFNIEIYKHLRLYFLLYLYEISQLMSSSDLFTLSEQLRNDWSNLNILPTRLQLISLPLFLPLSSHITIPFLSTFSIPLLPSLSLPLSLPQSAHGIESNIFGKISELNSTSFHTLTGGKNSGVRLFYNPYGCTYKNDDSNETNNNKNGRVERNENVNHESTNTHETVQTINRQKLLATFLLGSGFCPKGLLIREVRACR